MRTVTAALAIALLVGTPLAGVPASAEAGEYCQAVDEGSRAEACTKDAREGDPGNETATCEEYRGFTGVTAQGANETAGTSAVASVGGEETCESVFENEKEDERVFADVRVSHADLASVEVAAEWLEEGSYYYNESSNEVGAGLTASLGPGEAGAEGIWGGNLGTGYAFFVDIGGLDHESSTYVPTDVPPPSPPNPGWGDIGPDNLFEESLPDL